MLMVKKAIQGKHRSWVSTKTSAQARWASMSAAGRRKVELWSEKVRRYQEHVKQRGGKAEICQSRKWRKNHMCQIHVLTTIIMKTCLVTMDV